MEDFHRAGHIRSYVTILTTILILEKDNFSYTCLIHNGVFTCLASQCNDPPLPLKMNVVIPESLTQGAMAKYSCPDRYELVGDSVLTCNSGKWVGDEPYCKGT